MSGSESHPYRPCVSVCMATYNGGRFIARQLQTILPQLAPHDEIIISDDSSTDNTLQVIAGFLDERIRVFEGQSFHSATYNFEHALKQAKGQVIFLSDQDDEWVDGWLKLALVELRTVSLVVCDAHLIDIDGNVRPPSEATIYRGVRRPGIVQNLYRNGYIGCCCAFRREILGVALPFPDKLPWHDWWLGLIADAFFTTRFVKNRMIRYRRHGNNLSPTGEKSTFTASEKLSMRWHIGKALANRWTQQKRRSHHSRIG